MDECKPLPLTGEQRPRGRALHSFAFRLNVSAFCGIGGAIRGYQGIVQGVLGVTMKCVGCILCQKRLRLSWKVDECKPLPRGRLQRQDVIGLLGGVHAQAAVRAARGEQLAVEG